MGEFLANTEHFSIRFDTFDKTFTFLGEFYTTPDMNETFKPVFEAIKDKLLNVNQPLILDFVIGNLTHISYSYFTEILNLCADYQSKHGSIVRVNWYYPDFDNENTLSTGKELAELFKNSLEINLIEV